MMFLRGQTTEFHMYEYLLSCLLCRTALIFAFDHLLISQVTPESQMSLLRLTESCWEEDSEEILSHGLQPSQHVSSQHALCMCCVGIGRASTEVIGDTKQSHE